MDFTQDMSDDVYMKLSRILSNVGLHTLSKDDAKIDLLMLGKNMNLFERSLMWRGLKLDKPLWRT